MNGEKNVDAKGEAVIRVSHGGLGALIGLPKGIRVKGVYPSGTLKDVFHMVIEGAALPMVEEGGIIPEAECQFSIENGVRSTLIVIKGVNK